MSLDKMQPTSPAIRSLEGSDFWLVGPLQLRRTANGLLDEYSHELTPAVRPNEHATGPFCVFSLSAAPKAAGVYAIFVGGDLGVTP